MTVERKCLSTFLVRGLKFDVGSYAVRTEEDANSLTQPLMP
jgi:hypothetical protein